MENVVIRKAVQDDSSSVGNLFHQYRVFYKIDSTIDECVSFIADRIQNNESVIWVAVGENASLGGFAQMYPLFSEVSLKKIWLINDLFVEESRRKTGIATRLMTACSAFVQETGGSELTLATAADNVAAQSLYKRLGYTRNETFWTFSLSVSPQEAPM